MAKLRENVKELRTENYLTGFECMCHFTLDSKEWALENAYQRINNNKCNVMYEIDVLRFHYLLFITFVYTSEEHRFFYFLFFELFIEWKVKRVIMMYLK